MGQAHTFDHHEADAKSVSFNCSLQCEEEGWHGRNSILNSVILCVQLAIPHNYQIPATNQQRVNKWLEK